MTTADRLARAVREQVGLGRFLPLGGPRDGAWITERAVREVLREAARDVPGVRLDGVRVAHADPGRAQEPAVPPPPSALPPGPLRVTAECAAAATEPLPAAAARLRAALAAAAGRLGLTVEEVDLRVTGLLEETGAGAAPPREAPGAAAPVPAEGDEGRAAAAAVAVAGVTRLTTALGRPVRVGEHAHAPEAALPPRHVRVELAVAADHRAVEVARRVRAAVSDALPDHPAVAVLVTAVD
ncbi:nucleopolyhedrovirus P10 family protein [Streptomyces sp. PRKS01-65]|nr:nucleopolyhedrovirus P10 family protein [Streptomyces harenosi]NEY31968.1 nucleopolyhedrovirus P10 family protein [Streptomyces harenosi]